MKFINIKLTGLVAVIFLTLCFGAVAELDQYLGADELLEVGVGNARVGGGVLGE